MDPFAILGAPRRFDLDLTMLEKTHRELSRALHPDKFSQAGASERRAALEKAADVNEAYRMLRDPIRRAEELFKLEGFLVGETNEPKPSSMFLMEVMDEREALSEARAARDLAKVRKLASSIKGRADALEARLTAGFGQPSQLERAELQKLLSVLGELRFYKRFLEEVSAIEEEAEEVAYANANANANSSSNAKVSA